MSGKKHPLNLSAPFFFGLALLGAWRTGSDVRPLLVAGAAGLACGARVWAHGDEHPIATSLAFVIVLVGAVVPVRFGTRLDAAVPPIVARIVLGLPALLGLVFRGGSAPPIDVDALPEKLAAALLKNDVRPEVADEIVRRCEEKPQLVEKLIPALAAESTARRAAGWLALLAPERVTLEANATLVAWGVAEAGAKVLLPKLKERANDPALAGACAALGDLEPLRALAPRLVENVVQRAFARAGAPALPLVEELLLDPGLDEKKLDAILWIAREIGEPSRPLLERATRAEVDRRIQDGAARVLAQLDRRRG